MDSDIKNMGNDALMEAYRASLADRNQERTKSLFKEIGERSERNRAERVMEGVREYAEDYPVALLEKNGRLCIDALNEGGFNGVEIDLLDLLSWLRKNRPELLEGE